MLGAGIYHYAAPCATNIPSSGTKSIRGNRNPLHDACYYKKVDLLINNISNCDIEARNDAGFTPMLVATVSRSIDCAKILLGYTPPDWGPTHVFDTYVNLFSSNPKGMTPLHVAVVNKDYEMISLLLNTGGPALLYAKCHAAKYPSFYADEDVAVYLKKWSIDQDKLESSNKEINLSVSDYISLFTMAISTYITVFKTTCIGAFRKKVVLIKDSNATKLLSQLDADRLELSLLINYLMKLTLLACTSGCFRDAVCLQDIVSDLKCRKENI